MSFESGVTRKQGIEKRRWKQGSRYLRRGSHWWKRRSIPEASTSEDHLMYVCTTVNVALSYYI